VRSLNCPPGRLVAFLEVLGRTVWVNVVAQGEDRALHATDEPGCCLVALPGAVGDVARRDDDLPEGGGPGSHSGAQPTAIRIARVIAMTTLAILPLAPSTCQLPMGPA
jgi:hypothetical protein